jgi:hypothetical protein
MGRRMKLEFRVIGLSASPIRNQILVIIQVSDGQFNMMMHCTEEYWNRHQDRAKEMLKRHFIHSFNLKA